MFVCEEPGCETKFDQHKEFFDHFLHHYTNTPTACDYEGCTEIFPTMLLQSKHGKSHGRRFVFLGGNLGVVEDCSNQSKIVDISVYHALDFDCSWLCYFPLFLLCWIFFRRCLKVILSLKLYSHRKLKCTNSLSNSEWEIYAVSNSINWKKKNLIQENYVVIILQRLSL